MEKRPRHDAYGMQDGGDEKRQEVRLAFGSVYERDEAGG